MAGGADIAEDRVGFHSATIYMPRLPLNKRFLITDSGTAR